MKHLNTLFIKVILLTFLISGFSVSKSQAFDDAIIAVVNEEVITFRDLQEYIHGVYITLVAQGRSESEIRAIQAELEQNGIDKLVEDKLMLSRANKLGLEIGDKLLDEKMEEIKAKYPSEKAFIDALVENGATITDLENKILEQLKIKILIDHEVKSKVYVNPQEVTEFYEENITQFQKKESLTLDSIFIPYGSNPNEAMKNANIAHEMIINGEDFSQIAKDFSKAPSIGKVERGQLLPEIEDVVFKLKKGEVSDVLEVTSGIYILKLIEKIPAKLAELDDVKAFISDRLYRTKFKDEYEEWLDELKKEAYVEIKN